MRKDILKGAAVLLLMAAFAGLVMLSGGCSQSIQGWVDRGNQGIAFAQQNQTAWYQATVAQLNKDRQASIQAAFNDILHVMATGVPTPASTQPALGGPTTRPVDAAWVIDSEKLLLATMTAFDAKKADVDAKYATCMDNLAKTQECFAEIQKLNVAWANSSQALQAQMASMQATIQTIAQAVANQPSSK
jgi:hypothetical protein